MKITFSRNHDGDALVLVDGKVAAIAKTCEGYDYLKAHILAFSVLTAIKIDRDDWKQAHAEAVERYKVAEAKLAKLEAQEPVAWMKEYKNGRKQLTGTLQIALELKYDTPLYLAAGAKLAALRAENEALKEQHQMQLAAISTAAIGYYQDGDPIHPDYVTVALGDVTRLYTKYTELYKKLDELGEQSHD